MFVLSGLLMTGGLNHQGSKSKGSFTYSDCDCKSDHDITITIANMGIKAIFSIVIVMTCDIAM